jgi:Asp-tRNA(Asn)/Glu-tRNA(Gln) amidotransferase B subunit
MNEREQAKATARRWLDGQMNPLVEMVPGEPDCEACQIARSYLRALEKIERLIHLADHYAPPHAVDMEMADVWPSGKEK